MNGLGVHVPEWMAAPGNRAVAFVLAGAVFGRAMRLRKQQAEAVQDSLFSDATSGLPPITLPAHPWTEVYARVPDVGNFAKAPVVRVCSRCDFNFWWVPADKVSTPWRCAVCNTPPPSTRYIALTVVT